MNVLIRTIDRNAGEHFLTLRNGQRATVGRSAIADLAFPHDEEMSDPHLEFEVHRDGCCVKALNGAEVLVNEQVVDSQELQPMDVVVAGRTRLQIEYTPNNVSTASDPEPEESSEPVELNWSELLCGLKLAETSLEYAVEHDSLGSLIDGLASKGEFQDAVLLRAFQLGPLLAVTWACRCLKEFASLPTPQAHAVNVAQKWCDSPTEDLRREAEKVATDLDHTGSGAMVAWACFCCGDSVGPAEFAPIPPEPHVECSFVRAALTMQAMQQAPFEEKFHQFLEIGREMSQDPRLQSKMRAPGNELN